MPEAAKNAIEKRLETIVSRWEEFRADEDARLLRWIGDADDAGMLAVFLEVEEDEAGSLPDLFLRLDDPFLHPDRYGFVLIEALKKRYEEIRPGLAAEGIADDWRCPPAVPGEISDIKALVRTCASFRAHYPDLMETLVLALFPAQVGDWREWQKWLYQLARAEGLPPEVRFMILDDVSGPRLEPLCQADPRRIMTRKLALDMPGAMQETAQAADDGQPGGEFRRHLVALATAGGKGDLAGADRSAQSALAIAAREDWPHMQVTVHMALGAARAGAKRTEEALRSYGEAEKTAAAAAQKGDPVAAKLRVQARLSTGSALVGAGRFAEAGPVYEQTAPLAEAQGDFLFALESWRMAAYCKEAGKDWETAWRLNGLALKAGEKMKPDERPHTTLPYVGQALTRINNKLGKSDGASLKRYLDKTLGAGWEKKIERGASPA